MNLCFVQWGVFLLLLLPVDDVYSQFVFEQDIIQGGITAGGFSTGLGAGSGIVDLYIESGSEIKVSYLMTYSYGNPVSSPVVVNETNYFFDESEKITQFGHVNELITPISIYVKDITGNISPNETLYEITIPPQNPYAGYFTAFIVLIYENPLLAPCTYSIVINDQNNTGNDTFQVSELNPIDPGFPVGLSLYTDRHGLPNVSGSDVYFNDDHIGLIFGSDLNSDSWSYSGVKGDFYYQNNELFCLGDDVANETMNASDGLANVSTYINLHDMSLDLQITHIAYPNNNSSTTNNSIGFFLAYTTPCLPFETTLTEEVTICRGDTAQLLATGGSVELPIAYEWLPHEGLSCYNCPNPVFEGDSSKVYTVRIWNTDSCSKVLPVKVNVLDVPHTANLSTNPSTCGEADGGLIIGSVSGGKPGYQYSLGDAWTANATANIFNNLPGGDYTFYVRDQNHCYYSQDFIIEEVNLAQAAFSANPQSGTEPLEVQFYNQSNGTTVYEWMLVDSTFNSFEFNFTFDSAGSYPVQLIAWNNVPHCADTAMATIIVHPAPPDYSHSIFMPTLYNLEIGDFFIETTNVQRVEFEIYNAIGQHIFSTTLDVADGKNEIWNGSRHARGYYFFRIKYWDMQGLEFSERGKVLVVR